MSFNGRAFAWYEQVLSLVTSTTIYFSFFAKIYSRPWGEETPKSSMYVDVYLNSETPLTGGPWESAVTWLICKAKAEICKRHASPELTAMRTD